MNISELSKWVLGLLDALALLSLYATTEIRTEAGMLVLAIFLTRTLGIRLRSRSWLVSLVVGFVCLGLFIAIRFHVFPILVAAHVGIVIHALLWLGKDDSRDRILRLSMGFVNLTLASALTSDFYLFGSIFAFAILGSIYISLGFLESTFRTRLPAQLSKALPPGYLKNMLYVSFAVFLISIFLFPLIPRTSWNRGGDGSSYFQVGYNETVDLSSTGHAASSQSGRVALRITSLTPEIADDPREAIPWGLLRGKTLDLFDGTRWRSRTSPRLQETKIEPTQFPFRGGRFEVIREPQVSRVVFKPYGALISEVDNNSGRSPYLFKTAETGREIEYEETPDEKDLEVPPSIRNPRLTALARSIMGHGGNSFEKVRLLSTFYKKGFTATLEATQNSRNVSSVLDNFLLQSKQGSCELFAASAALLLRLQKVPARVVAGYRVNRRADAGLLTVLDADGHAWVEYWHEGRGWLPLDPTPQILRIPNWVDSFHQLYWLAAGKWFHWMINFRKDDPSSTEVDPTRIHTVDTTWTDWSGRWKNWRLGSSPMAELALLAIGLFMTFGLFAKMALGFLDLSELKQIFGAGLPWSRRRLYLEYLRFERLARKLDPLPEPARKAAEDWRVLYQRVRFGPPEPAAFQNSIKRLGELTRELKRAISLRLRS